MGQREPYEEVEGGQAYGEQGYHNQQACGNPFRVVLDHAIDLLLLDNFYYPGVSILRDVPFLSTLSPLYTYPDNPIWHTV